MVDFSSMDGNFVDIQAFQDIQPDLRVAFILMDKFTLAPVAGFVEALRFAADKSFRSEQVYCQWDWMTLDNLPVKASCGLYIQPTTEFNPFDHYDYVVLAGGLLSETRDPPQQLLDIIQQVYKAKIPLITLCSSSFVLGKLGILDGRKCAVHWAIKEEFEQRFPNAICLIDRNFIEDNGIFTCPGGTAIDLATNIIRKNCGNIRAYKGLEFLLCDDQTNKKNANANNEIVTTQTYENTIVSRAVEFMKQNLGAHITLKAVAEHVNTNPRQLHRAFVANTSEPPAIYWRRIRLEYARNLLANTSMYVTNIAMDCGFSDASHFILWFKKQYGETPFSYRKRRHSVDQVS
ncbi:GlxA family transcriptional regulator [Acinetobacter pseudolwoffii]|uniref:GlxA family transcriptional regulator n=1 Tax=Acinetobacter pseudolwoffii TaxID=2053287 RepID=UPI0025771C3C|nr:helix-turn-helix domain-containing protein [Acinetobacter pseudolwoffii]MDM1341494.1 helix-turn-helix domain-containing protein [Acinetobacter pseudolwoffii]